MADTSDASVRTTTNATGPSGPAPDAMVDFGERAVPVWPNSLQAMKFDENVFLLVNDDLPALHQPLIDAILEDEERLRMSEPLNSRGLGGMKVRDLHRFNLPVFTLIEERVKQFFMRATGSPEAYVDDCWANVFRNGEFTMPHCHNRAMAAVVYGLDQGDEESIASDPLNGVLTFADPRMKSCCQDKEYFVNTPARAPQMPGRMIIFPGQYTHLVTPYFGKRRRISLAWNINPKPMDGGPRHDGRVE